MRRLSAIFIICAVVLFSNLFCYADEQFDLKRDLPLAMKYETNNEQEQLDAFIAGTEAILAEQQLNINTLSSVYYLGYAYAGSFDGISLKRSMSFNMKYPLNAPIYKSEIYKGYYRLRTEKLLKQYSITQTFDYGNFTKTSRLEFDKYMMIAVKSEAVRRNLMVLLQEKLMDKLVELEPSKRKAFQDEIYSLGMPENSRLYQDYLYQVYEYGIRVELINQMLEINSEKLAKLAHDTAIRITAEKNGKLLLQYKNAESNVENLQVLNAVTEDHGYNGITVLSELYGRQDCRLVFMEDAGYEYKIDMDKALGAISSDDEGYLQLKLDSLLVQNQADIEGSNQPDAAEEKEAKLREEQIKALEAAYKSKAVEAQAIIKELNRYSIYLELKNQGINNYFTRKFESDKKSWKATLEAKLNSFGPGGMADFAVFIKQFVLASRNELGQSDREKALIARFRNSVVQFRQPDDSSVWVTNMLYNLKYMK